jgi:hypothetical protein
VLKQVWRGGALDASLCSCSRSGAVAVLRSSSTAMPVPGGANQNKATCQALCSVESEIAHETVSCDGGVRV